MNSQQEYEKFLSKVSKSVHDIRDDFNHLSPENQQRFIQETNTLLSSYGYAITAQDLIRRSIW